VVNAALHRLVGARDGEAGDLAEEEVGPHHEDALVDVLEVERGARVAEGADVAADHHADRPELAEAAERDHDLVRAVGGLVEGELPGGGELAEAPDRAPKSSGGVALTEGAELDADDVAAVPGSD
jgi:hypothetical protein